jgi:hypothetical protein
LRVVPKAGLKAVPKAGLKAIPKAGLKAVPKAGLKAVPKAGLKAVPKAGLKAVPKAGLKVHSKMTKKSEGVYRGIDKPKLPMAFFPYILYKEKRSNHRKKPFNLYKKLLLAGRWSTYSN